jgi:hypothetical protein
MFQRMRRLAIFVFSLVFFAAIAGVGASSGGFDARMTTVAGSGELGYRDGPALSATFVLPVGVALGPNGSVYVSDAGSQRIRIIHNGQVRTLAGSGTFPEHGFWVRGGFADGPGLQARFNFPAGLAVDSKGKVYVADAGNHCVRAIDPDGAVSTYSGAPDRSAEVNGSRATAGFHWPMGVALDAQGDLYVADEDVGIRKIAADGTVSTVLKEPGVTGVAISPDGRTVLGTDLTGGVHAVLDGGEHALGIADPLFPEPGPHLGNLADIGHPFAAAMIDTFRAIYTDGKTGAIRYIDLYLGTSKFLTGDRNSDATNDVTGFRDGPLDIASTSDPLGVALTPSGTLYVADAGNRRIRAIAPLNFRQATIVPINALPPEISNPASKNVFIVGNSYIWANSVWDDSWEGLLEKHLRAAGKNFTIYPILAGATPESVTFDYIKGTLADLPHVDRVIFMMNVGVADASGANWRSTYVLGLRQVRDALAKNATKFSVIIVPTPYDFDWQELPVVRYLRGDTSLCLAKDNSLATFYDDDPIRCLTRGEAESLVYRDMLSATRESGVEFSDLAPYFLADARQAVHQMMFGTSEGHASDHGRAVMADAMFSVLAPGQNK